MYSPTKIISILGGLVITLHVLHAQTAKITVSGTVKDATTGETLIGVALRPAEIPQAGAVTNEYGFYSLSIPGGRYQLQWEYLGYEKTVLSVDLRSDTVLDIHLRPHSRELGTVEVVAEKEDDKVTQTQIGMDKINMQVMNKIPVLLGERDILKTIQLMAGVQPSSEGNSGFYVRGGSTDQNLILLDEAVVYNPSHLFGFFSVFNSDAIKDATLYKGNAPAQYGGRLSSVLDIKMNEGDNQNYHISGGLGLISSHLNVEGPIQKGKSSFLVTGRRTYADLFLKLTNDSNLRKTSLYFYDINAKMNFRLSKKSTLYISGYYGSDQLSMGSSMDWSNGTSTIRWNYLIHPKLFSNTCFTFSDYTNNIRISADNLEIGIHSEIMDFNLRQEFQYYPSTAHALRFGFNSIYHIIRPGDISRSGDTISGISNLTRRYSWENALYAGDEWKITKFMKASYGIRLVSFSVLGGGNFYTFHPDGSVADTLITADGDFVTTYVNAEPRLSLHFQVSSSTAIKVGYARHTQFLHLLSNSTATNPTDRWVPSSNNIRPEIADQVSLGVFQNIGGKMFEVSLEGYFKQMQNTVDYKDGADILNNELYEAELLYGEGRAYGMELTLKKKEGKFTGWVAYTFSRTEKQINGINNGSWYPAKQDRTHDISLVLMYEFGRFTFSGSWVYYTGNAVTFPSGKYQVDGKIEYLYTERNGYRMPDYHRMDLGITVDLRNKQTRLNKYGNPKRKMIVSELSFGAYNTYAMHNAYSINFRQDEYDPTQTVAVKTYLFSVVPYISYNFKY